MFQSSDPSTSYPSLAALVGIEVLPDGRLRAHPNDGNRNNRLFGGQLLGFLLAAAAQGTAGRAATSLQVQFLQSGLLGEAMDLQVETVQSGRRFMTQHVRAMQGDRLIALANAGFQAPGQGFSHCLPMPSGLPDPETLPTLEALNAELLAGAPLDAQTGEPLSPLPVWPALDRRLVDPHRVWLATGDEPACQHWVRSRHALGDAPEVHAAALAYMSDSWYLFFAALTPHTHMAGARDRIYGASLNHTLWLHQPCRADDWLLFDVHSPQAGGGRTLVQTQVFSRNGAHVATIAQELSAAPRAG